MRRFLTIFAVLASAIIAPAASIHAQETIVYLVRHAERAIGSGDVPISDTGRVRANALLESLREARLDAIITTQFQRTKQTAEPLASALSLQMETVAAQGAAPEHAAAVANAIRAKGAGKNVLVVGHSNTVPAIIAALGGPKLKDLCDDEYDNLFVVVLHDGSPVRFARARFGAPAPAGPSCAAMR
jgi:broad specificity phosphatase PhoE